jgi:hypothetical protein
VVAISESAKTRRRTAHGPRIGLAYLSLRWNELHGATSLKWLEPWEPVRDSMDESYVLAWETELAREAGPGHPLYQVNVALIARRFDRDDALYLLPDGRVAAVHLTWRQNREPDPLWPETEIFQSIDSWETDGLAQDHAAWRLDQND